jgi:hypothetical protein
MDFNYFGTRPTRDAGDSFLRANLRALLEARIIATQDREIARAAAGLGVKLLGDKLKEVCPHDIRVISNFLETDFESATESIVLGLSMACISQVAHGIAVCGVFLDMLGKLTPGVGLVVAVADIASFFATRSALANERILNYAKLLSYVYEMLLSDEAVGKILESNVLVTAVDERSFTAFFRHNAFRRNDGAWCDFRHIEELRCAPIARNYRGGQIIQRIIDIYNRVMRDGHLDLDAVQRYINDVPAIERPLQEARAEETHG